jgi:hypothetical protein
LFDSLLRFGFLRRIFFFLTIGRNVASTPDDIFATNVDESGVDGGLAHGIAGPVNLSPNFTQRFFSYRGAVKDFPAHALREGSGPRYDHSGAVLWV